MEDNIGKICPFCKTEIKEGEDVKVCPACGIAHHAACWEENKGCTTFGCSEQHHEEQYTNPTSVCANCGAPLGDGQAFCPKCGTQKAVEQKTVCSKCGTELKDDQAFCPKCGAPREKKKPVCSKCGAELEEGQDFCPKCGQKADLQIDTAVNSAINQFNSNVDKANQKAKKKPIKAIIAGVCAVVVIILGILVVPKIFKSADDYMAAGNFEKAYSMAKDDKKADVVAENTIAYCCSHCVDSLKDSKSFDLRDAWYSEDGYVVLKVAANNSYGNTVINYWLYSFSSEKQKWSFWDTYTDFDDEEYSKYDSTEEMAEKLLHNMGIKNVTSTMANGWNLSKKGVTRINDLFAADKLDSVELLEAAILKKE